MVFIPFLLKKINLKSGFIDVYNQLLKSNLMSPRAGEQNQ